MIDVETEQLIDIKEAANRPEFRVNGKATSFSRVWRLILKDELESLRIGGKRVTSVEAIRRMIARQNPGIVPTQSPRQRETELRKLERELSDAGI